MKIRPTKSLEHILSYPEKMTYPIRAITDYGEMPAEVSWGFAAAMTKLIMFGNSDENVAEVRKELTKVEEMKDYLKEYYFTPQIPSCVGDVVEDANEKPCECLGTFTGIPVYNEVAYQLSPPGRLVSEDGYKVVDIMDVQVDGKSILNVDADYTITVDTAKLVSVSGWEGIRGPVGPGGPHGPMIHDYTLPPGKLYEYRGLCGPVGFPGATGVPGQFPAPVYAMHSVSNKPLMYSIDMYRSIKDNEYVAICSFPLVSWLEGTNVKVGDKIKPYAIGRTQQEAQDKLSQSITGWTSRKELGVINVHEMINRWVCVVCHSIPSFISKQELTQHMNDKHGGNLNLDRYTNPVVANQFLHI